MNGLALSKRYFFEKALPKLERSFPDMLSRIAAGLVGNGSECFGYDDETSRDHDWGIDFFLWVPHDDAERIEDLKKWKQSLFSSDPPEFSRHRSAYGATISVMENAEFYDQLIGCPGCPKTLNEWVRAPEENLALCTNGEVFTDELGEFTAIRNEILRFYPEDLRKKRIATRCMLIAQTGQYNLLRMARRDDIVAARTALSRFSEHVIALVFLLNKAYRPYYKWAWRRMTELSVLGCEIAPMLRELACAPLSADNAASLAETVEQICALLIRQLNSDGLADSTDSFMTAQGEQVQASIENITLRGLPTQYEI